MEMFSPLEIIKIFALTTAVIFLFFSFVYYVLYSIKAPNFMSEAIRIISFILLGGGSLLLAIVFVI